MYTKTLDHTPHTFENDEETKRAALTFINNAWSDALAFGVDADAVAHAAMFTAFVDLVSTYGEDAVAELTESLPERVRRGDYSVNRYVQ